MQRIQHTPTIFVNIPWSNDPIEAKCRPFYSHREDKPGCQFSNLYPASISINTSQTLSQSEETFLFRERGEIRFPSSENAFQCAKAQEELYVDFVLALDPLNAARAGQGRLNMNKHQRDLFERLGGQVVRKGSAKKVKYQISENARYLRRPDWETLKKSVMMIALKAKFSQHPHLWKEYVEAPHMTFFIEHTQNDNQWGDAGSGNGTNFLGKMLTALLWETRTGQTLDRIAFFYLDWLHTANVWVAEDFYRD